MKPVWTIHNAWKATYKGKPIYYIRLPKYKSHFRNLKQSLDSEWMHSWVITPYLHNANMYEEQITNEGLQDLIWDHMHYCFVCDHGRCVPGVDKTILGKELKGLCRGDLYCDLAAWFVNPSETTISGIKTLLELEKNARNR